MLAANAHLDVRAGLAPPLNSNADQIANAFLIETDEGVLIENTLLDIGIEEPTAVIAANTKGGLCQVIGTERKEFGGLRQISGAQSCPRQFDHGAHLMTASATRSVSLRR